jgi:hypothetical protein
MRKILGEYIGYWLNFYQVPPEKWMPVMDALSYLMDEFDKVVAPEVQKSWKEMRKISNKSD